MKLKMKIKLWIGGGVLAVLAGPGVWLWWHLNDTTPTQSSITISKETTFVDGPLDQYGYVDYVEALNSSYAKGVTAENNAAIPLFRALGPAAIPKEIRAEFFERLGMDVLPESGDYFQRLSDETLFEKFDMLMEGPWKRGDSPDLADWIENSSKQIELFTKASNLPQFFSPLISKERLYGRRAVVSALLPVCGEMSEIARAFCLRAMLHLGEGRNQQAIADLMTCHRLNRLVNQNPTLIGGVIAGTCEKATCETDCAAANSGLLSRSELQSFQNDLQSLRPLDGVASKVDQAERMVILDIVTFTARNGPDADRIISGGGNSNGLIQSAIARDMNKFVDWDAVLKTVNQFFDRSVKIAELGDRNIRETQYAVMTLEIRQMVANAKDVNSYATKPIPRKSNRAGLARWYGDLYLGLLFPSIQGAWNAEDEQRMRLQMTILTFALARLRSETGAYPSSLEALGPKYISRIPTDLFSGKPLIYIPSKSGYRLTSVGVNGVDDASRIPVENSRIDDITIRVPAK